MSKNFEKEYIEYLNAQAPDLWDRIEAGVDALDSVEEAVREAEVETAEKAVPISAKKSKKAQKKRRVRYQHYRMVASVAACLFAIVIIVPVYLFTRQDGKSEMAADSVPQKIENVTIENLVVDASESEAAAEEAAPMEGASDGTTEIEIPAEIMTEEATMTAEATEHNATGTDEADMTTVTSGGESGGQVAEPEMTDEEGDMSDMLQKEIAGQQKEMTVTILGEGAICEGGVMYKAVENGSESSATVSLFVSVGSEIVLEADGVYVISAKISVDGLYYTVESAALQ